MPIPNFFILGAAKCGTTALHAYLKDHPAFFMPQFKEPHYFSTDIDFGLHLEGRDRYLELYKPAGKDHRWLGDSSVYYIYSRVAARNILEFNPDARMVLMLRNPVDMIYSLHAQFLWNTTETEADFEALWRRQEKNRPNDAMPEGMISNHDFRSIGRFGEQVQRLFDVVPRDQVKVILFDDFRRDSLQVYRDVLAFLDTRDDGRTEFPRINESKRNRSNAVKQAVKVAGKVARPVLYRLHKHTPVKEIGLTKLVDRLNSQPHKRPPLSPEFRAELQEWFREDLELLAGLIDRDLSAWMAQPATTDR